MLIQNISKRNFVLKVDGEAKTITPNTIIDAKEDLAKDLVENYNNEWIVLDLPKSTDRQEEEKVVQTKSEKKKK